MEEWRAYKFYLLASGAAPNGWMDLKSEILVPVLCPWPLAFYYSTTMTVKMTKEKDK